MATFSVILMAELVNAVGVAQALFTHILRVDALAIVSLICHFKTAASYYKLYLLITSIHDLFAGLPAYIFTERVLQAGHTVMIRHDISIETQIKPAKTLSWPVDT